MLVSNTIHNLRRLYALSYALVNTEWQISSGYKISYFQKSPYKKIIFASVTVNIFSCIFSGSSGAATTWVNFKLP